MPRRVVPVSDLLAAMADDHGAPAFAACLSLPMTDYQAEAMRLESRYTVVRAPRQTGKSRSLAVVAVWAALRRPAQTVLIVSASELGARRLLSQVREVTALPLLRGDVLDEGATVVQFANGSRVIALPASERAVRGWSADVLLVDEAAFISDDLLEGAVLPTTLARPEARVVMASSPWTASGTFFRHVRLGEAGTDAEVRAFRWVIGDAPWVRPGEVDRLRATMSPARFRCEVEGEFADGGAGFFSRDLLLAATADYALTAPEDAHGGLVVVGLDYGNANDSHAAVFLGVADDLGMNETPPLFVPFLAASQEPYLAWARRVAGWASPARSEVFRRRPVVLAETREQVAALGMGGPRRGGYDVGRVMSERNGVGAAPTEFLQAELGRHRVTSVATTQQTKETGFSRIATWLGEGLLVLPNVERLLSELTALEATETQLGGLTIKAAGTGHDDLAMAFCQAALAVDPRSLWGRQGPRRGPVDDEDVVWTPGARVLLPRRPAPATISGLRGTHYLHSR